MNNENKNWYAVYTKSRCEKKADRLLQLKQIESWCPVQKMQKQWSDRKKIIEEPLFKSYVFVHINENEKLEVLKTEGIIQFIYYLGKPAIIRDREIDLIKCYLLEKDAQIQVEHIGNFKPADKVKIQQGVFMDKTGIVLRGENKKVYVQLESLGQLMVVSFPNSHVIPVGQ